MIFAIRLVMKNRLFLLCLLIVLGVFSTASAQRLKVFSKSNEKEIHYAYRGLNGNTSNTINKMLEWFYNPDDIGSLSFKLMFEQSVLVEFVDGLSYDVTVDIKDLYVRNLAEYAGFDLSEEFMPQRVELYVDLFKSDRRWRGKRIEAPLVGHGLREPVTFTVIDSIPGVKAKITGYDFLFTRDTESRVFKKLSLINQYLDVYEELDAIGLKLNNLDEKTTKIKTFENHKAELQKLIDRFLVVNDNRFWILLDYKQAETRSGFNVEATRDEVQGYLAYKKEQFGLASANFHKIYFDKGLDYYKKGKKGKALDNFLLARQADPEFAPARYMIALHLYEENLIDSSAIEVAYILGKLETDQETYDKSLELAYAIKDQFMEKGLSLIGTVPEEEVVSWFRKALDLCKNSMEMTCDQREFEAAMKKVHGSGSTKKQ